MVMFDTFELNDADRFAEVIEIDQTQYIALN